MRQKITSRVHNVYATVKVRYPDVNMNAKDEQAAGDHLQFVNKQLVTVAFVDLLFGPLRKRVRGCCDDR